MGHFPGEKDQTKGPTTVVDRPEADWQVIEPAEIDACSGPLLDRRQARLWALILEARGLACQLEQRSGRWYLQVPGAAKTDALLELRRYEEENRNWPPPAARAVPLRENSLATCFLLFLLGLFHYLTSGTVFSSLGQSIDWLQLGSADAGAIRAGQWWRAATALTLHTNGLHLLGNLIIGGFFIVRLNRELGVGRGWALILLSGLLGNLANALLQPSGHRAVGLSTAIFGGVAILAVRSARHHRRHLRRRWPLPLAAGLALLGLLGSGGEATDLGGHLWGFIVGLGLGWLSALLWPGGQSLPRRGGLLAGLAAAALLIGSWLAAFSAG